MIQKLFPNNKLHTHLQFTCERLPVSLDWSISDSYLIYTFELVSDQTFRIHIRWPACWSFHWLQPVKADFNIYENVALLTSYLSGLDDLSFEPNIKLSISRDDFQFLSGHLSIHQKKEKKDTTECVDLTFCWAKHLLSVTFRKQFL